MREVLCVSEGNEAFELAPELRGLRAHERDGLQEGVLPPVPRAAAEAALHALPVVAPHVVLHAHAHLENLAEPCVVEDGQRKAEIGREEARGVGVELVARLDGGGLEHLRVVVRGRERRLDHGPALAAQGGEGGGKVVGRGERDEYKVDFGVVEHVLHPTVGVDVGIVLLDDVAPFLHEVAHRHDLIETGQGLERGNVVEERGPPEPRDSDADGRALRAEDVLY